MKRLVYSPKINAYIKADSGVYDVSEYITEFQIDRKINQVSTAELTLRNPYMKWTNNRYRDSITGESKVGPIFHPMDPITIMLTRLQNRPVQVFTGYCDSTPYLQLFPGTVPLTASCTLKKLQYTYFDAGLPFMEEFLIQNGWFPSGQGESIVNPKAETEGKTKEQAEETNEGVRFGDSGIGELLFEVLNVIGGWPEDSIYIQEMPASVITLVSNLFELFKKEDEQASEELTELLTKIVGTASLAETEGTTEGTTPSAKKGPLAEEAFRVKGTTTWTSNAGTVTIAKWIKPALIWAKETGGNTEVTSGYRPEVDTHTSSGRSEHQGDSYQGSTGPAGGIVKGAIDFGGFVDPVGKEHRESFLQSLAGYPGPMLIKATGFEDDGHCSATGK